MRISAINSGMLYSNKLQRPVKQKTNNQTFKGYWDAEALRVLERSYTEMLQFGKLFHKSSDATLKEVTLVRNLFGKIKQDKSQQAYQKLKEYVDTVKLRRTELESRYNTLKEVEMYDSLPNKLKAEKEKIQQELIELDHLAEQSTSYYVTDAEIARRNEQMKEISKQTMREYYEDHVHYDW